MTREEAMSETYNKIISSIFTYRCKRNQDLGLVDEKVEKKLNSAVVALGKQLDKVLKIK